MKKCLVFTLAMLVIGLVGGISLAAEKEFLWKYVGRQAYTGQVKEAVEMLPIPLEVRNIFLEKVKSERPRDGVIRKGDRLDAMVFGKGEMKTNVLADWEDGVTELKDQEWIVGRYMLKRPVTCNNWAVVILPEQAQPQPVKTVPAPSAVAPASVVPPAPTLAVTAPNRIPPASIKRWVVVNMFKDREDFWFRQKYLTELRIPGPPSPYFRTILALGHDNLVKEVRQRPVSGGKFTFFVISKKGDTLGSGEVVTGNTGQAEFPVTIPLEQIGRIEIVPDAGLADIIPIRKEGVIRVKPEEFSGSLPLNVWFVQTTGLTAAL